MIELGAKVIDKASGLKGIVTGVATFLNGCIRCQVQPPLGKDGTYREVQWIDEAQLEEQGRGLSIPETAGARAGGPQSMPNDHRNPAWSRGPKR